MKNEISKTIKKLTKYNLEFIEPTNIIIYNSKKSYNEYLRKTFNLTIIPEWFVSNIENDSIHIISKEYYTKKNSNINYSKICKHMLIKFSLINSELDYEEWSLRGLSTYLSGQYITKFNIRKLDLNTIDNDFGKLGYLVKSIINKSDPSKSLDTIFKDFQNQQ